MRVCAHERTVLATIRDPAFGAALTERTGARAAHEDDVPRARDRRCLAVGYDSGPASRRALRWAASQLAPRGKLVVVHACRPLHALPSPLSCAHERLTVGRAMFDELLLESDDTMLATIDRTELCDADPVTTLRRAAREHHADAIVVGQESRSRLHGALGTVTGALLSQPARP
jgi:nucleotide-binding universal stress UspA family protein